MKLTINLATRRYVNQRQLNAVLAVSFALLAVLLVYLVRQVALNQAEIDSVKKKSAAADLDRAGVQSIPPEQIKALEKRIAFGNALIEKKAVDWLSMLDKLEQVVPAGVALTQIQPNLQRGTLQITGVALAFGNLRSLLESMEQSQNFTEVYLLGQNERKVGKSQHGLGFTISCKVSDR